MIDVMDDSPLFTVRNRSHSFGMIGLSMADSISNFTTIQGDSSGRKLRFADIILLIMHNLIVGLF